MTTQCWPLASAASMCACPKKSMGGDNQGDRRLLCLAVPALESDPEPQPREARTDPDVRVAKRRARRFDDTRARSVVDHSAVAQVEDIEEHARLMRRVAKRNGLFDTEIEDADRIRPPGADRFNANGFTQL